MIVATVVLLIVLGWLKYRGRILLPWWQVALVGCLPLSILIVGLLPYLIWGSLGGGA